MEDHLSQPLNTVEHRAFLLCLHTLDYVCACVSVCHCVHTSTAAHGGQNRVSDSLELELDSCEMCECWYENSGQLQ